MFILNDDDPGVLTQLLVVGRYVLQAPVLLIKGPFIDDIGVPVRVIVNALVLLSTNGVEDWQVNNAVLVIAVNGVVLGVNAEV